jgi:TonB family protein
MLDAAALDAVRQWRCEPTIVDGKSVPVTMTVSVSF